MGQGEMILSVTVDGDEAFVSVRNVPVEMPDREVRAAIEHGAASGCARCGKALAHVSVWCDMVGRGTTRVYRDGAL